MGRPKKAVPSYLLHKPTGQARVRIDGRDVYLGRFGSTESKETYARLIAEHAARAAEKSIEVPSGQPFTISSLLVKFDDHARRYYVDQGKPSEEVYRIRAAIRPLVKLYSSLPVADFSPLKLKAVREEIIRSGRNGQGKLLSRGYVNDLVATIKRIFKWGVGEELVPPTVYQSLTAVPSLEIGRASGVREPKPVRPVSQEFIDPVLGLVSPEVASMIQLQQLTGMRPDEVTIMRPCDINTSHEVWVYRPHTHKVKHRGIDRIILLGPKAKEILTPWLDRGSDEYLFNPKAVVARLLAERRESRKHPPREKPRKKWLHPPRDHYDDDSYRRAVERACRKAGIERWTPNQLRHTAATEIRREFGIEAAQLALGHRSLSTTEIYAEKNMERYAEIVKKRG